MKRFLTILLVSAFLITVLGRCQKTVSSAETYSFPEPTTELTVTLYSQGQETTQNIADADTINSVISWFYSLKLTPSEPPQEAEGGTSYDFIVNGEPAFTYLDYGSSVYLVVEGCFSYQVKNPLTPPSF